MGSEVSIDEPLLPKQVQPRRCWVPVNSWRKMSAGFNIAPRVTAYCPFIFVPISTGMWVLYFGYKLGPNKLKIYSFQSMHSYVNNNTDSGVRQDHSVQQV